MQVVGSPGSTAARRDVGCVGPPRCQEIRASVPVVHTPPPCLSTYASPTPARSNGTVTKLKQKVLQAQRHLNYVQVHGRLICQTKTSRCQRQVWSTQAIGQDRKSGQRKLLTPTAKVWQTQAVGPDGKSGQRIPLVQTGRSGPL